MMCLAKVGLTRPNSNKRKLLFFLMAWGELFLFSACSDGKRNTIPPYCMRMSILPATGDYYLYEQGQTDIRHLVTHASLTRVGGTCSMSNQRSDSLLTQVGLVINVQRGPALTGNAVTIPYFIALVRQGKILDKHQFEKTAVFADNTSQMTVETPLFPINMATLTSISDQEHTDEKPAIEQKSVNPQDISIIVGFQLSAEQLYYNRYHISMPHYSPF